MKREVVKPGRNSPCWCASGAKFKHCHLNRDEQPALDPHATVQRHRRDWYRKECMLAALDGERCSGTIIRAHTIQRSGGLSAIAEKGHVLVPNADVYALDKTDGNFTLKRIGIADASTFTGFCAHHDDHVFAPLEKFPFAGTAEQCALLHLRALARELHAKSAMVRTLPQLRDADKGRSLPAQLAHQSLLTGLLAGAEVGLEDLQVHFDAAWKIRNGEQGHTIEAAVLQLKGTPQLLVSAGLLPDFDFNGNRLQDLGRASRMEGITFSIIPTEDGGRIVIAWDSAAARAGRAFAASLVGLPLHRQGDAMVRLCFAGAENIAVAPTWWRTLDHGTQAFLLARIREAADTSIPVSPHYLADDGRSFGALDVESFAKVGAW